MQPGQFQAVVVSKAIANGWRRTLPAALAPRVSDVFIVATATIILLATLARSLGPKVSRVLVGVSAVALFCFAIYQLYAASAALVGPASPPA